MNGLWNVCYVLTRHKHTDLLVAQSRPLEAIKNMLSHDATSTRTCSTSVQISTDPMNEGHADKIRNLSYIHTDTMVKGQLTTNTNYNEWHFHCINLPLYIFHLVDQLTYVYITRLHETVLLCVQSMHGTSKFLIIFFVFTCSKILRISNKRFKTLMDT